MNLEKTVTNIKIKELIGIEKQCIEFILQHKLYKSDKTGKIINPILQDFHIHQDGNMIFLDV